MSIRTVNEYDTPNQGRLVWNANDQTLDQRLSQIAFNVRAAPYNAVGDGENDDQPAIQSAINDCYAQGGGFVYMPTGDYRLRSGPLLLRDRVNLVGAGMFTTTVRLGDRMNTPVITDESAGVRGSSAIGRVLLSDFGIEGNAENNPNGAEGIFTSAYYSTFERLFIRNVRTHGIRMGFSGMDNYASQNRVAGCRIVRCAEAGLYLDIHGVDHDITSNYISTSDIGVVICNGGVRLTNNDIFGHRTAAVRVQQTVYNVIIASNDINANQRDAIYVTRTTDAASGPWGQILITSNSILGDQLSTDNTFDAIVAETNVAEGLSGLTINGNKIFNIGTGPRYRHGIHLERNVVNSYCAGNHITNTSSSPYQIGRGCSGITIDSLGKGVLGSPPVPRSGTALVNPYHTTASVYLSGGEVRSVSINGVSTGLTSGMVRVAAGQSITLTYTRAPRWVWIGD